MKNKINFFEKIIFIIKRPRVIVVLGEDLLFISESLNSIINKDSIIFLPKEKKDFRTARFLLKMSKNPILALNKINELERIEAFSLSTYLPSRANIVFNENNKEIRKIKKESIASVFIFGFDEGIDFRATDINLDSKGVNFKINYKGNTVPFWSNGHFDNKKIYSLLCIAAISFLSDINLVEVSEFFQKKESLMLSSSKLEEEVQTQREKK